MIQFLILLVYCYSAFVISTKTVIHLSFCEIESGWYLPRHYVACSTRLDGGYLAKRGKQE